VRWAPYRCELHDPASNKTMTGTANKITLNLDIFIRIIFNDKGTQIYNSAPTARENTMNSGGLPECGPYGAGQFR
jgi:hypothetical protein